MNVHIEEKSRITLLRSVQRHLIFQCSKTTLLLCQPDSFFLVLIGGHLGLTGLLKCPRKVSPGIRGAPDGCN